MTLKVLTFNHHEPYLCSLAETNISFDVVTQYGKLPLPWKANAKPCPPNIHLISFDDETRQKLRSGAYDVVICHTVKNLLWMFLYFKPSYVFIAHIPLFFGNPWLIIKSFAKILLLRLFMLLHRTTFFAVSEFKRRRWFTQGAVAVLSPQIFPSELMASNKEKIAVSVGNQFRQRAQELGYPLVEAVSQSVPVCVIGDNPGVPNAFKPASFQEFVRRFSAASVYLFTVEQPQGDGYNTAMLEAMAMGIPVVTIPNPSSPIQHGVNGLIGKNAEELALHVKTLLENPDVAARFGAAAAATVRTQFSKEQFLATWKRILRPKSIT